MERQIKKSAMEIAALILAIAAIWYAFKISTFSSLSEDEIKGWLHASELVLVFSAVLLAVGLVGEWQDSASWKKRLIYKASKSAVIIGVLGELLGDAGIFESSAHLQLLSDIKVEKSTNLALRATNLALRAELALLKVLSPRNLSADAGGLN
jgi:hypothetical protein